MPILTKAHETAIYAQIFSLDEIEWMTAGLIRLGTISIEDYYRMQDGTPIIDAPEVESLAAFCERVKRDV
jgi:hypothetical protein